MGVPVEQGGRLNVGGVTIFASDAFTRPADTTAYTIADQVAATTTAANNRNLEFIVARVPGGSGIISSAILIDSTSESTKPYFDLLLFDSPVTNVADNAAAAPTDAEVERAIPNGVISFDGVNYFKVAGANGVIPAGNLNIPFVCREGTTKLYGILVARNAYTPISSEKFTARLGVLQD